MCIPDGAVVLHSQCAHRLLLALFDAGTAADAAVGIQLRFGHTHNVKALFIKFWFNGAICFFIFWGLGLYVTSMLDMIFVLAVVMGMVTDILVNNAFRFLATYEGQNDKWMMFPKKKYWTFVANILYAFPVLVGVIWFYNVYNIVLNMIKGTEGEMYLGVEPIVFGLSYMAIDMLFITMKHTMIKIISDAKQKNR